MISFARALGAARTGDIAGAEAEIGKLQSLEDKLNEAKDTYWANQVEVQRLAAAGILAHARRTTRRPSSWCGQRPISTPTMDKHPATPAPVLPARELLADLLLELNDPAAARAEYEQSLRTEPNRFRSLLGKAGGKRAGDPGLARGLPSCWRWSRRRGDPARIRRSQGIGFRIDQKRRRQHTP